MNRSVDNIKTQFDNNKAKETNKINDNIYSIQK